MLLFGLLTGLVLCCRVVDVLLFDGLLMYCCVVGLLVCCVVRCWLVVLLRCWCVVLLLCCRVVALIG